MQTGNSDEPMHCSSPDDHDVEAIPENPESHACRFHSCTELCHGCILPMEYPTFQASNQAQWLNDMMQSLHEGQIAKKQLADDCVVSYSCQCYVTPCIANIIAVVIPTAIIRTGSLLHQMLLWRTHTDQMLVIGVSLRSMAASCFACRLVHILFKPCIGTKHRQHARQELYYVWLRRARSKLNAVNSTLCQQRSTYAQALQIHHQVQTS